jgi:hypothetical protein
MSEVPDVIVSVTQGGRPVLNSGLLRTHVVIGAFSAGPYTTREVNMDTLISTYTSGDALKAAARAIDRVSANALVVRRNHTAVAATKTTTINVTGTAIASVTGTPTEAWEIDLVVTSGATIVSGSATYSASKDGGETVVTGSIPSTGILSNFLSTGLTVTFDVPEDELVDIATEIQSDFLAHFANATAHNSADTDAAALITLDPPTNNEESVAVLNECLDAIELHEANDTVHDSIDVLNVPTVGAATNGQTGRLLAINLKTKYNLHRQASFPADTDALHAATATVASPVTLLAASLIAGGLTQLAGYPSPITFTTAGVTPADAPATVTVVGLDENGDAQTMTSFPLAQTAATVTTTEKWSAITSVSYPSADGTSATIAIGLPDAAHNSADSTNIVAEADPSSGTVVTDDSILVSTTDPSPAVVSLVKSGGGTLTVTASGTPLETVNGRIEFLNSGTVGVDGGEYRVSLDGGNTWQPTASLGEDDFIEVMDHRKDYDGTYTTTGVTLDLVATETFTATTVITFRTTGPRVAVADVITAIGVAAASSFKTRGWRLFHIVGNYAVCQFRDKRPYEDESDWIASVVADRALLDANRIAPCAGYARSFTCPITGRLDRRPAAWLDVVRRLCVDINVESGRYKDGPLGSEVNGKVGGEGSSGDITLYEDGERVEYDADEDATLANARITVLRTFKNGGLGTYVNGSRMGTGAASKFTRTRDRELMDEGARALANEGFRQLLDNVRRNPGDYPTDPAQPGDPGTILEADALDIELNAKSAIKSRIGSKANSITMTVGRTDDLTGDNGPRLITEVCVVEGQPVIESVDVNLVFNG